jgi:hypothetical protein
MGWHVYDDKENMGNNRFVQNHLTVQNDRMEAERHRQVIRHCRTATCATDVGEEALDDVISLFSFGRVAEHVRSQMGVTREEEARWRTWYQETNTERTSRRKERLRENAISELDMHRDPEYSEEVGYPRSMRDYYDRVGEAQFREDLGITDTEYAWFKRRTGLNV